MDADDAEATVVEQPGANRCVRHGSAVHRKVSFSPADARVTACLSRNLQNSGQMDAGALSARVASGDEAIERPRAGFRSRFQYFWSESASPFSPAVGNGHRPSVATCGGKRIVPEKGAEPGGFQSARRTSWLTVSARMPNIKWQEALACPRTRRCRPPNSSLRRSVYPFRCGTLVVSPALGILIADHAPGGGLPARLLLALRRAAGIAVDDRNMAQGRAVGPDLCGIVGAVHQINHRLSTRADVICASGIAA